jgi:hypothetical protein
MGRIMIINDLLLNPVKPSIQMVHVQKNVSFCLEGIANINKVIEKARTEVMQKLRPYLLKVKAIVEQL